MPWQHPVEVCVGVHESGQQNRIRGDYHLVVRVVDGQVFVGAHLVHHPVGYSYTPVGPGHLGRVVDQPVR